MDVELDRVIRVSYQVQLMCSALEFMNELGQVIQSLASQRRYLENGTDFVGLYQLYCFVQERVLCLGERTIHIRPSLTIAVLQIY